jgi:hypothetical protein
LQDTSLAGPLTERGMPLRAISVRDNRERPDVARFYRQNPFVVCRLSGDERTKRGCGEIDVFDPTETWADQEFRRAKALFVPSLKRGIVPFVART